MSNCSVPGLIFNYGRPEDQLRFTRGQSIKFAGFWPNVVKCQETVSQQYRFVNATFVSQEEINNNALPNLLAFLFDVEKRKLSYTIPARAYAPGRYVLALTMSYKGEYYAYSGYVEIVQSPLKAVISNNNFQTFPTKSKDGTFHNSTLDALKSRDPDNQEDGLTGKRVFCFIFSLYLFSILLSCFFYWNSIIKEYLCIF